jgi:hypothetical protein
MAATVVARGSPSPSSNRTNVRGVVQEVVVPDYTEIDEATPARGFRVPHVTLF